MLFRAIIVFYSQHRTKPINAFCGQDADLSFLDCWSSSYIQLSLCFIGLKWFLYSMRVSSLFIWGNIKNDSFFCFWSEVCNALHVVTWNDRALCPSRTWIYGTLLPISYKWLQWLLTLASLSSLSFSSWSLLRFLFLLPRRFITAA
jgi:hypothetical protein